MQVVFASPVRLLQTLQFAPVELVVPEGFASLLMTPFIMEERSENLILEGGVNKDESTVQSLQS